eukprot:2845837-Rhodomonas_salina.2
MFQSCALSQSFSSRPDTPPASGRTGAFACFQHAFFLPMLEPETRILCLSARMICGHSRVK